MKLVRHQRREGESGGSHGARRNTERKKECVNNQKCIKNFSITLTTIFSLNQTLAGYDIPYTVEKVKFLFLQGGGRFRAVYTFISIGGGKSKPKGNTIQQEKKKKKCSIRLYSILLHHVSCIKSWYSILKTILQHSSFNGYTTFCSIWIGVILLC